MTKFLLLLLVALSATLLGANHAVPVQQSTAAEVCITPWEWFEEVGDTPHWRGQQRANLVGSLDLRSRPQMATAGGAPQGYMIAVYDTANICTLTTDPLIIWEADLDQKLSQLEITALEIGLGLPPSTIQETILVDVIFELYTIHSDPTGDTKWGTLIPTRALNLELYLGGFSKIKSVKLDNFTSPEGVVVLAALQDNYRKLRDNVIKGDVEEGEHQRLLTTLSDKYDEPSDKFIASDLPKEDPLPHKTLRQDTFNRGSSNGLGTSSDGWTWTELQSENDIGSGSRANQAVAGGGNGSTNISRSNGNIDDGDHYVQAQLAHTNHNAYDAAVMTRKDNTATMTFALGNAQWAGVAESAEVEMWKWVAGTATEVGSSFTQSQNDDTFYTYRMDADGTTYTIDFNAVEKRSETITNADVPTANSYGGILLDDDGGNLESYSDNYEADSLGAAPVTRFIFIGKLYDDYLERHLQEIMELIKPS